MVVWKVIDDDEDWVKDEHQAWDCAFEIAAHGGLEALDFDIGGCFCDAELVYKGEDCAGGDAAAAEGGEGVETGVVPCSDVFVFDEFLDFAFGEDGAADA